MLSLTLISSVIILGACELFQHGGQEEQVSKQRGGDRDRAHSCEDPVGAGITEQDRRKPSYQNDCSHDQSRSDRGKSIADGQVFISGFLFFLDIPS